MSDNPRHLRLAKLGETAPSAEEPGAELAVPDDAELESTDEVVDAILVDDEPQPSEPSEPSTLRGTAVAVRVVGRLTPSAERRRQAASLVVGTGWTVGQGLHSWWVRAWDGLTHGVYRRQIRVAEATGDTEALAAWADRRQQVADRRRARLKDLPGLALGLARLALGVLFGIPAVMVVLSTLIMATGAGSFNSLWVWTGALLRWIFNAVAIAWSVLVFVAPALIVVAAWREGRRRGSTRPTWVPATAKEAEGRQVIPDESAILHALQHLGIAALNKAFKAGWRPRVVLPTQRDGKGYRTQLELPPQVTVEMITEKKKILAHNLVRHAVEVWPTEPRALPGILDLWVADQGALSGPVPDWPLLTQGTADYFRGVPVAIDLRGDTVIGGLFQKNYAIAGMMGSGKSTLIITLLLGAILDFLVEIDVFVFATNADYDPLKRRLRTLRTGPGDEVVKACLDRLREVYDELSTRGQALQEHGEPMATRALALKDKRLRPRIIVIDECQALFLNDRYGEEACDVCVKLTNAARKYGVTVIFATPEASSDSLPRKLMSVISNKACFAIGDQTSNDAVLNTGSYKAGISAVGLEPKTEEGPGDIGTFMGRGFKGKPGLLRSYYVPYGGGVDMATPVVDRALALLSKSGITAGGQEAIERQRDLLQDVAEVLGDETLNAADVAPLLAPLAPRWPPYTGLTGVALRERLAELGVRVPSTGNLWPISPELIRRALAARNSDDGEGGDDPS